ncbi:hypothetical protein D3C85_740900 [compost metagenome]
MAPSTSRPVGWPFASFRISPPDGAVVAALIPAALSAALETATAWPSARLSSTTRPGAAASRSAAVRKRFSGQWVSIQPRPTMTPSGWALAQSDRRAMASTTEAEPSRFSVISRQPMPSRWAWPSVKPGNRVAPFRSTTSSPSAEGAPAAAPT